MACAFLRSRTLATAVSPAWPRKLSRTESSDRLAAIRKMMAEATNLFPSNWQT